MPERADAHIHLFEGGYRRSFAGRPGVSLDEAACYDTLARDHGVRCALVVGYAAEPWCVTNNAWIALQARAYPWVRPLAYVDALKLALFRLEQLAAQGYVGLSLYITTPERADDLGRVPHEIWSWLEAHRWPVSVNSSGELWRAWRDILDRHAELRLLISHLGLPPRVDEPPSVVQALAALGPVLSLARYSETRVKLSGFYALTHPSYAYPHQAAWPYVGALLTDYGVERLLWASDYSPCLDEVTFPQTYGLFSEMPFVGVTEREAIEGGNLLALLGEA